MRSHLGALCALGWLLAWAPSAQAVSVGAELLVAIDGKPGTWKAFGGPDASTNVPVDVVVSPGEILNLFILIDIGVAMQQYDTLLTADDPLSVDYVSGSASETTGLGFLQPLGDPNTTLQDGTPGSGDGDSNLDVANPRSSNELYRLQYVVSGGFVPDGNRDVTVEIQGILFENGDDSLDPLRDTVSLRLIPEPASGGLAALGLALLLSARARSRRGDA